MSEKQEPPVHVIYTENAPILLEILFNAAKIYIL